MKGKTRGESVRGHVEPSVCVRIPKSQAQTAILLASRFGLMNHELEIKKDANFVYIPLLKEPSDVTLDKLKKQVSSLQVSTDVFLQRKKHHETLQDVLEGELPPHLIACLPHSADIIGDIAIVEIPLELKPHEKEIGEAVLKTNKNIHTVLAKAGPISGTYRLREFSVIAGEPKTVTIHKENGCKFSVDVAKVYFSPRLSHEHDRVASLVKEGEIIIDLFAGVGPFAVQIAKKRQNVKVYAVDINPQAIELLKRNIRLNRVDRRVVPILGDARETVNKKLSRIADRVIMNLPESAIEYVDVACSATSAKGGTIHLYGFVGPSGSLEDFLKRFKKAVEKGGRQLADTPTAKYVRDTAPYERQVVLDGQIR